MKILIAIFMFFVLGALLIISNNNLVLGDSENVIEFRDLYFSWLDKTFLNMKSVTGYAVDLGWEPE